jgi:hypothetical protein
VISFPSFFFLLFSPLSKENTDRTSGLKEPVLVELKKDEGSPTRLPCPLDTSLHAFLSSPCERVPRRFAPLSPGYTEIPHPLF